MTEEKENGLSKDSTLTEVFDFIDMEEGGVNVIPVTVEQDDHDTRLAIFIRGEHGLASFLMAQLMTEIQNLFDLQQQAEARAMEDGPQIERV